MNGRLSGREGKHRGQALVEFALAFTIFLLVLLGVVEFGRLLIAFSSVYAASREAARYGAAVETISDCPGIREAAVRVGAFGGVQADDVSISYPDNMVIDKSNNVYTCHCTGTTLACDSDPTGQLRPPGLGDRIKVTVTTKFQFIVLNFKTIDISSFTTRSIIKGVQIQPAIPTPTGGGAP